MPKFVDKDGLVIPDGIPSVSSAYLGRASYGRPPGPGRLSHEALYREVPAVFIVSRFLAKNVAQLPLHVFVKEEELRRTQVRDHPVVRLLARPNPGMTRFGWMTSIVEDLHIHGNTYWRVLKDGSGQPVALVRVDPRRVQVEGRFWPETYRIDVGDKQPWVLPSEDVFHLKTYNPSSNLVGLSPLDPLMGILMEDKAATEHRQAFWTNGARPSFFLTRPMEAPPWQPKAREAFKAEFYADYSGERNSGKIPILEEGMGVVEVSLSAREQQFLEARMQVTQMVCSAFGVTPAMLGLPDSGTSYASVREMHTMLYQDTLGPLLEQVALEIERQLLPLFTGTGGMYVEFNFRAKLHGSPTEQAAAIQTQVGGPVLTRNEARAAMDLPPIDGGNEIITPLNVVTGGLASPTDTAPKALPPETGVKRKDAKPRELWSKRTDLEGLEYDALTFRTLLAESLEEMCDRQGRQILARWEHRGERTVSGLIDAPFWDTQGGLHTGPLWRYWGGIAEGTEWAREWQEQALHEQGAALLERHWRAHTASIMQALGDALRADDPEAAVLLVGRGLTGREGRQVAQQLATTMVRQCVALGQWIEAEHNPAVVGKRWVTTSKNPRDTHAQLHGQTVKPGELFANGARYPGDPDLPAAQRAKCQCQLELIRKDKE